MIAVMAEQHNGVDYQEDVVAVFTTQEKADNFLKAMQDFFEYSELSFSEATKLIDRIRDEFKKKRSEDETETRGNGHSFKEKT